MRIRTILSGGLAAALLAGGVWYAQLDAETRGILAHLPTNADVLGWSQPQRDAAFRAMDRLPVLAEAASIAPVNRVLGIGWRKGGQLMRGRDIFLAQVFRGKRGDGDRIFW